MATGVTMRSFRVRHSTCYVYESKVNRSRNLCMLLPRTLDYQKILRESMIISPEPEPVCELSDGLGNRLYDFTVTFPHSIFEVILALELEVQARSWRQGCATLTDAHKLSKDLRNPMNRAAQAFLFPSKHVYWDQVIEELTASLRAQNAAPHVCAQSIMERIFTEWKFQAGVTNIHTTVADLLRSRVGVCQDFSHLQIAALRNLGIPARYVSGYLETLPKPGKPKLVGADVSHAWVQAYDPIAGWKDFDPTNNLIPGEQHITLAFGRDFADIALCAGLSAEVAHKRCALA